MVPLWSLPAYWRPGQPPLFGPEMPEIRGTGAELHIETPFTKGFNAEEGVEHAVPVYPGDHLHGTETLTEVTPKHTSLGDGIFMARETRLWNQADELVSIRKSTSYRYKPAADRVRDAEARPRDQDQPGRQEVDGTNPDVDWSRQLFFEDVQVGDEVPAYHLLLTYQRIVMSVASDRMWSPIHHNRDAARAQGLADTIFNTRGYEMVFEVTLRRWMGLDGQLKQLGPFRMRRSSHPGDLLTCRGHLTGTEVVQGEGRAHVEIWVETPRWEAARAQAVISLPRRG